MERFRFGEGNERVSVDGSLTGEGFVAYLKRSFMSGTRRSANRSGCENGGSGGSEWTNGSGDGRARLGMRMSGSCDRLRSGFARI